MTEYTWKIVQLDCTPSADGQTNVVSNIHWLIEAIDGTNEATIYGTQPLIFNSKNAFINYADLTKNQVLKWLQEAMGTDVDTALKALDKKLETLANPPVITPPLPWAN